ncbi:hypothetical protein [Allosediminivita pacifica]|uniref:Uncharacterized protein n=1 Tax=Allosediminivita pacifica TaxID=1267769 RepID=A0A2T5ZYD9_9RHOB|nr:hypothetical protein [Allosediminivita pacifica]PTX36565.1 hypothetical protein C8N44_15610 [Allosediminivita pacifica]
MTPETHASLVILGFAVVGVVIMRNYSWRFDKHLNEKYRHGPSQSGSRESSNEQSSTN